MVNIITPYIRIIGDPILQKSGIAFPENPNLEEKIELKKQFEIAKEILINTGGAGIAANQCANIKEPYQFTIVGVYNDNPMHVENVNKRYPDVKFPDAIVMINPKIENISKETITFTHGCLSVPGRLRGEIKTPKEITVSFKTYDKNGDIIPQTKTYVGIDAVVLQHELNHILLGKTYIDFCMAALNSMDLSRLEQLVLTEINDRNNHVKIADLNSTGDFYKIVTVDGENSFKFHSDALKTAFQEGINTDTLFGLIKQIDSSRGI